MQHLDDISLKNLAEGIVGQYVHGSATTFGYVRIEAGSKLPLHQHIHEQITFIIEGELEMTVGAETFLLTAGSSQVIPSNTPHSAIARTACIVIDVFSPARNDYR